MLWNKNNSQIEHNSVVFCRKNAPQYIFNLSFGVLDQNFVLSNQDGLLVGRLSFQEKKLFAALQLWTKVGLWSLYKLTSPRSEKRQNVVTF